MERQGPFVRCLMCVSGSEISVVHAVSRLGLGTAICPMKTRSRRIQGIWHEDSVPLLPGYVFVYHDDPDTDPRSLIRLSGVLRVLKYDDEPEGFLRGSDLDFAMWLSGNGGQVGKLSAVDEGSFIRVTDGLLKDMHGTVLSVDRRKRLAKIRLDLAGDTKIVYLNYELLSDRI